MLVAEAGEEMAVELQGMKAAEQWAVVNGWLDGRGRAGCEEAFDLVLYQLVTLVHGVLKLRLSKL